MVKTLTKEEQKIHTFAAMTDPAMLEGIGKLAEMFKLLSDVLPKFEVRPLALNIKTKCPQTGNELTITKHYIAILIEKPEKKENVSV